MCPNENAVRSYMMYPDVCIILNDKCDTVFDDYLFIAMQMKMHHYHL